MLSDARSCLRLLKRAFSKWRQGFVAYVYSIESSLKQLESLRGWPRAGDRGLDASRRVPGGQPAALPRSRQPHLRKKRRFWSSELASDVVTRGGWCSEGGA